MTRERLFSGICGTQCVGRLAVWKVEEKTGGKRIWRRLRRGLSDEFSEEWQSIVR